MDDAKPSSCASVLHPIASLCASLAAALSVPTVLPLLDDFIHLASAERPLDDVGGGARAHPTPPHGIFGRCQYPSGRFMCIFMTLIGLFLAKLIG